jgi:hypothetical protein
MNAKDAMIEEAQQITVKEIAVMTTTTMTDREKLVTLLDEWKVEYAVTEYGSVRVERGYFGFYTDFIFKNDGSFKDMGAYE